jgi:hypothetical protein
MPNWYGLQGLIIIIISKPSEHSPPPRAKLLLWAKLLLACKRCCAPALDVAGIAYDRMLWICYQHMFTPLVLHNKSASSKQQLLTQRDILMCCQVTLYNTI